MTTALHDRMLDFNYGDTARSELMRKVWSDTPWMVDAYTGAHNDRREREMLEWCYATFGDQAFPLHDRPGSWQRGGATVFGWTWFGFSTREQMEQFEARWPTPDGV